MINLNSRIFPAVCFFVLALLPVSNANAQLTGSKTIPTDYLTIAAFVADLNTVGVGPGGVTFTVPASHIETAPAGGFVITATGTLANPIVIQGGGMPLPVITASAGHAVGALNDAIFLLRGSDYVTIQGLQLQENVGNIAITPASNTMTEWGIALVYATTTDGAKFNTISNNTISLNKTYSNTFGIYSNTRHAYGAVGTTADVTSPAGSNSNNKFYGNSISNVNLGIALVGSGTAANMDMSNDVGGSSAATGNTITNWGGLAPASTYVSVSGTSWCILSNHQVGENISYNTLTSAAVSGTAVTFRGIFKDYGTGQPSGTFTSNITNNTITMSSGFNGGTFEGVKSQGITPVLGGVTVNINNNNLLNCAVTGVGSTSGIVGFSNSSAVGTLSISNNIIQGCTSTATSGGFTGVVNSGGVNGTINLNGNQIGNGSGNAITFSAAQSGTITALSNTSGTAAAVLNISNNNIQGIVHSVNGSSTHNYINVGSTTTTQNLNSNTFTNLSVATTGSVTFFTNAPNLTATGVMNINNNSIVTGFTKPVGGGTFTIHSTNATSVNGSIYSASNNNFSNITLPGATNFVGINNTDGLSTSGSTKTIVSNTFNNITMGTGTVNPITANFSGPNTTVTSNTIGNITAASAVAAITIGSSNQGPFTANSNVISNISTTSGAVNGILINVPGTNTVSLNQINNLTTTGAALATGITSGGSVVTLNIFKNKIYGITANNAGGSVNGISVAAGTTVSIYNNVIGNLTAPLTNSASDAICGINLTSTAVNSNIRVYYNSIYLNTTSAGANFSTTGIFHTANATATTAALDLRNNIIINLSTATGTGTSTALKRSGVALSNYAATSNRNLFYAGAPSATQLIYTDGTTPQQTFTGFQTAVATREANSITGEAFTYSTAGSFFISLTGSSTDFLKPVAGITTLVESAAVAISTPLITDDYSGIVRAGNVGYTGTGTAPDMGAFEFEGMTPAPVITLNTVLPALTSQCAATARAISMNITTASGTITGAILSYSFNGVAQTPIAMTNTSGSTWEVVIPAATPANASVTWSVTAASSLPLSSTFAGTGYNDAPLFGFTAVASASSSTICSGSTTVLSVTLSNPVAAPSYGAAPSVANPTTDEDLGNVTITQGATVILNNTSTINTLNGSIGIPTGTAGSYSNYTSFGPYALSAGATYNYSVSSVDAPSFFGNAMAIYIDYNRNGVFTDAGEQVLSEGATTSGPHTATGSFVVPAGAQAGLTRMRVMVNEGLVTGPTMAVSWGEFEEYAIDIKPSVTLLDWSDGIASVGSVTPLTVSPTVTTTYTASLTSGGCVFTPAPTVVITVNPLPTAPTAANSSQCGTQVPTASVSSTTGAVTPTFKWYTAATGGTLLQTSTSTTYTTAVASTVTYFVSEVDGVTGCESSRTPITITVINADAISANTSAAIVCIGGSFDLTAANTNGVPVQNYTYTWTGVAGSGASVPVPGTVVTITPTIPGTYTYTATGVDGGCTAVATVNVTINPFAASLTPVNITCNGLTNGTFTLASSTCGTMPYTYAVNGGAAGPIPTNLPVGSYSVVVQDANGYTAGPIVFSITQPATIISNPVATGTAVCQDDLSALVTATTTATGTVVVPFNVLSQPVEVNAAPGNIVSSATYALPVGATVTSANLNYNNLTATGGSWMSEIRLGFSGAVVNAAAAGTGSLNSAGTFNYTRVIPVAAITPSGTVNLLYWDNANDNAGAEAIFPTGTGVATLTITYSMPSTLSWWDASTGGTQIGTGSPFETVGTSVLPNTSTTGTFTVYAQGQSGSCQSVARTAANVVVKPNTSSTTSITACDSYTWTNGTTYTTSGAYIQTLVNSVGCDSIATLNLTIKNSTSSNTPITACNSYTWTNGTTYTVSGTYTQTLVNSVGCDSIATLTLTIKNSTSSNTPITACTSYTWTNGTTYTVGGTYTQTLVNSVGCDSIATLTLTINAPNSSNTLVTACDSYTWTNGTTYTVGGSYTQTLTNVGGCDSVATLTLTIKNSTSSNTPITACNSYTWTNGTTYTVGGTYTQALINSVGCDSVATLTLTIKNSTSSNTPITACNSYTWTNGTTYTIGGTYTQTLINSVGCDSVATLTLTINLANSSNTSITACNSYTWTNGTTYTIGGTHTQTLTNVAGCDSVATLTLTINSANSSTTNITACNSYTWTNGSTYTVGGTYTQTLTNMAGCDSVATLTLIINNSTSSNVPITACDFYTWTDGNTYAVSGTYTQTLTNSVGCDSVATLTLIINSSTNSTTTIAACDSYTWTDGNTYLASGTYTQTLTNSVGCDSIATLVLTIGNNSSTTVASACDDYTWTDGNTYTVSGAYTQTLTNIAGCDSVATLNLTIGTVIGANTPVTACDSFTWTDGNTYTVGGTYTQTLTAVGGCDSIISLTLTINNANSSNTVMTACDSYTWTDGNTYTAGGTYTQTLTNMAGCDSVATLTLTINSANTSSTVITQCDSYTWTDGNTYTVDGIYTQTLTNVNGCDSVATLDLTINNAPVPTGTDSNDGRITASAGSAYQWIDCTTGLPMPGETGQVLNVPGNGSYAVIVTDGNGCSDTSACVDINYMNVGENTTPVFAAFPNPTHGMVTINMDMEVGIIDIVDAQGNVVYTVSVENGGQVDMSSLARGVYYLRLRTENEALIQRVVRH